MSFQQGLSGLNASSKNLEIIGNNIANANTFGSKSSRAEFSDLYAASLSGAGSSSIGIGTKLSTVAQQFTQGNITITENPMDLAINGAGFFQLSDGKSPTVYSRNGQFKVDKDGFIVNNDQLKLLGYPADGTGKISPGLAQPLQLPTKGISPQVTNDINMEFNLDSRSSPTAPIDAGGNEITGMSLTDPSTYNNATSLTVYDKKGQPVAITMYFQRTKTPDPAGSGGTVWNVYVTSNDKPVDQAADGSTITPTDPKAPVIPYTQIIFPRQGGSPLQPLVALDLYIPAGVNAGGASTLSIPFDAATADPNNPDNRAIRLDITSATENGSSFAVTDLSQNGYAPGQLTGIQIEKDGVVTARYSNGQSKAAGQLELASFRNNMGLQPMGGNAWGRSNASGEPVVGVPGDGNLGVLSPGSLEESNVDLTAELVNMVTAQRVYQANAQSIKTLNDVLQTLVNLR